MRETHSDPHGHIGTLIAVPSQQEIDLQIAQARRAQSAGVRHLVASTFAALDRRFHRATPATN